MPKQVAVVSGATGDIGRVVVRRLLQEGYQVIMLGRRQEALDETWYQLQEGRMPMPGTPLSPLWFQVDLHNIAAIQRCAEVIERCDLLVTCHGAPPCIAPSTVVGVEHYHAVLDVDLRGTFLLAQMAGKKMLAHGDGGSIVLLSSFHALGSYPQRALYAMAKAGVCGLARALACEWAGEGIRVNAIAPGQIDGRRTRAIAGENEGTRQLERMRQRAPAGKLVQAEDIAETVMWLTRTPGVNGQTIVLDHGVTASLYYEPYVAEER